MKNIIAKIEIFFQAYTQGQTDLLNRSYTTLLNELNARGMLCSSHAKERFGKLYADELKCRIQKSWELSKKYFEKQNLSFSETQLINIKQKIKDLIEIEKNRLLDNFKQKLNLHKFLNEYYESTQYSLNVSRNQLLTMIQSEINLYVKCKESVSVNDIDAFELKPNVFGIGLNINHIIKRFIGFFNRK